MEISRRPKLTKPLAPPLGIQHYDCPLGPGPPNQGICPLRAHPLAQAQYHGNEFKKILNIVTFSYIKNVPTPLLNRKVITSILARSFLHV